MTWVSSALTATRAHPRALGYAFASIGQLWVALLSLAQLSKVSANCGRLALRVEQSHVSDQRVISQVKSRNTPVVLCATASSGLFAVANAEQV
jgi:hypothetical protein